MAPSGRKSRQAMNICFHPICLILHRRTTIGEPVAGTRDFVHPSYFSAQRPLCAVCSTMISQRTCYLYRLESSMHLTLFLTGPAPQRRKQKLEHENGTGTLLMQRAERPKRASGGQMAPAAEKQGSYPLPGSRTSINRVTSQPVA